MSSFLIGEYLKSRIEYSCTEWKYSRTEENNSCTERNYTCTRVLKPIRSTESEYSCTKTARWRTKENTHVLELSTRALNEVHAYERELHMYLERVHQLMASPRVSERTTNVLG